MVALQTKAIIIPIGIRGTQTVLPPDTWRSKIGEHVSVHIGKPIDTAHYSADDRDLLMAEVRKQILALGDYQAEASHPD